MMTAMGIKGWTSRDFSIKPQLVAKTMNAAMAAEIPTARFGMIKCEPRSTRSNFRDENRFSVAGQQSAGALWPKVAA